MREGGKKEREREREKEDAGGKKTNVQKASNTNRTYYLQERTSQTLTLCPH